MAWSRSGTTDGIARVTFLVNRNDDPELYQWIISLPYGETSPQVRAIMSEAVKKGAASAQPGIRALSPLTPKTGHGPLVPPIATESGKSDTSNLGADRGEVAITAEFEALLQEMHQKF